MRCNHNRLLVAAWWRAQCSSECSLRKSRSHVDCEFGDLLLAEQQHMDDV